jgi:protease II
MIITNMVIKSYRRGLRTFSS